MRLSDNVNGLQHIGYPSNDRDQTVRFLTEKLGFSVVYEAAAGARFLRRGDLCLEVYPVEEPPFTVDGGRHDELAVTVDNLEDAAARAGFGGPVEEQLLPNGQLLRSVRGKGPDGEGLCLNELSGASAHPLATFSYLRIPVADLRVTTAFYEELGFEFLFYLQEKDGGGRCDAACLALGDWIIKLVQREGWGPRSARDSHLDHMALDIRCIGQAFASAKASQLELLHDQPQFLPFWQYGVRFFTLRGPDGQKVELSEMLRV